MCNTHFVFITQYLNGKNADSGKWVRDETQETNINSLQLLQIIHIFDIFTRNPNTTLASFALVVKVGLVTISEGHGRNET